ncbi:MAG: CHAT domain-containing protein [candidate division Zixibacteria bacterium]|nr:CHAT domain-containing protein [candidate division Zixibacteria bacterium]
MIPYDDIKHLADQDALAQYLVKTFDGDIERFITGVNDGLHTLIRTDLTVASDYVRCVARLFGYLPEKFQARRCAIEARYCHWIGDHKKALRKYQSALVINEQHCDWLWSARVRRGLMDVHMYLGHYRQALEEGHRSLRFFLRHKLSGEAARVMNNIGNIYHRMDNNRMALRFYERARRIFAKEGGVGLAIIEYNRANIYANLNQLTRARELYHESGELYAKLGMHIAECQARYSLAYVNYLENRYAEALRMFEEVHDRFVSLGDRKTAAITQLDLAEINLQVNQYGTTIMQAEGIIPGLRSLGMRYEEGKAYYFLSQARAQLSDYTGAADSLSRASELFRKEHNSLWLGMVHVARARLALAQENYSLALRYVDRARAAFRRSGDERRATDADVVRMEVLLSAGDIGRALRRAASLKRRTLLSYQEYTLYYLIGKCYYLGNKPSLALNWFKAAVTTVEKVLESMYPDEIRFFFVADKYDIYRMTVECLLRLKRPRDSFLTNLKALQLLNQQSGMSMSMPSRIPPELQKQRDALRARLMKLQMAPGGEFRGVTAVTDWRKTEQKLWSVERKIRAYGYAPTDGPVKGEETEIDIVEQLRPDETLLNYLMVNGKMGVFCVTASDTAFIDLGLTEIELQTLLRKLGFVCEKSVFGIRESERTTPLANAILEQLYLAVFAPLVTKLAGRNIIVIADGPFYQIPFLALRDTAGRYVRESYEIRMIANPRDVSNRQNDGVKTRRSGAIFAVSSDTLPSIRIEAEHISRIFGKARLYLDTAADRKHLLRELGRAGLFVHVAAHASRSSENPLFSKIFMGDGPLFPFDLFGTGIRPSLVTLSGCQTAAPGLYYGNSFSLAKAFYQAGSRFVLASLWPVSDRLSMLFMVEFYRALARTKNIYRAYTGAMETIVGMTENPMFWSSFILLGI